MPDIQHYSWEFDIPVARPLLWKFVSDTDRINRLAGLFKVDYEYKPLPGGGSEVHCKARVNGVPIRWIERPSEWVEPQYFVFTRDYEGGPVEQVVNRVELHDGATAGHTRLVHAVTVKPRNAFGALLSKFTVGVQTKKGFTRAYGYAAEWARSHEIPAGGSEQSRATPRTELLLREKLLPAGEKVGHPELAKRLGKFLLASPDSEIAELRPYAVADTWKTSRKDLLRLFLYATKDGVFDLHWRILCPGCRRGKGTVGTLAELKTTGHCPSCNIDFGVDFDRSVEVTFSPKPIGLGANAAEYCHFGPRNTPHRVASWNFKPGEKREVAVYVEPGKHQVLSPQSKGAVFCEVNTDSGSPMRADVRVLPDGISGIPQGMKAGTVTLLVENATGTDATVAIVRTAWADIAATAADVTAMQEFRSMFSSQILAPGAEFSIQNMVFLFSDLVGSTEMYEKIGDATAFSLVRDHFDLLRDIYTRHNGSLVKTIGDAVMAVFREPADAIKAAIEMHEKIGNVRDARTGVVLSLRIGLHQGPCIAMEANGRLDYFGTTVNMAARVQGTAGRGDVAMSEAIVTAPSARQIVANYQAKLARETTKLKGLSGRFPIHHLQAVE